MFRGKCKCKVLNMSQLLVNNKTITLGKRVYQVRNITSIGKYKLGIKYVFRINFVIACIGLGIISVYVTSSFSWITTVFAVLASIGILERMLRRHRYGISIETNSGNSRFIASKDERFIDTVIGKMHQVLQDQDTPVSYTYNVAQGDIINMSGDFETGISM